jgi:hypothetical protein
MGEEIQSDAKRGQEDDLEALANEKARGIVGELVDFLRDNKKWWLIPIVVALLLIGLLVLLGGTAMAPFIYTLF